VLAAHARGGRRVCGAQRLRRLRCAK
jgi:hypothetical protein